MMEVLLQVSLPIPRPMRGLSNQIIILLMMIFAIYFTTVTSQLITEADTVENSISLSSSPEMVDYKAPDLKYIHNDTDYPASLQSNVLSTDVDADIVGGWQVTEWGECSSTDSCFDGTQTRTVTCKNPATGDDIDEQHCTMEKPHSTQSCRNTEFFCKGVWGSTEWGECSSIDPCIEGTQRRMVTCKSRTNYIDIDEKYCTNTQKPSSSQQCKETSKSCRGNWAATTWGECSSTSACYTGVQARAITCKSSIKKNDIDEKYCDIDNKLKNTQECLKSGGCSPTITSLTVDGNSFKTPQIIKINWTITEYESTPSKYVNGFLSLHNEDDEKYMVVLATPLMSTKQYSYKLPNTIGFDTHYYLKLSAFGFNSIKSSRFSISSPCSEVVCPYNSFCRASSAECECYSGYSGPICEELCEGNFCLNDGVCYNGECICTLGWSGPTCNIPDRCPSSSNSKRCGDRGYLSKNGKKCDKNCTCIGPWTSTASSLESKDAAQCTECSLSCRVGVPNSTCTACECGIGTHGDNCACRHLLVTFRAKYEDWMEKETKRFTHWLESMKMEISLITDLSLSLMDSLPPKFAFDTDHVIISLIFLSTNMCIDTGKDLNALSDLDDPKGLTPFAELKSVEPHMQLAYDAADKLATLFKDKSLGAFKDAPILSRYLLFSYGLALDDPQCYGKGCPESIPDTNPDGNPDGNPDDNPDGNTDDNNNGMDSLILGLIIGIGCLALVTMIIIGIVCIVRNIRRQGPSKQSIHYIYDVEVGDIELTSHQQNKTAGGIVAASDASTSGASAVSGMLAPAAPAPAASAPAASASAASASAPSLSSLSSASSGASREPEMSQISEATIVKTLMPDTDIKAMTLPPPTIEEVEKRGPEIEIETQPEAQVEVGAIVTVTSDATTNSTPQSPPLPPRPRVHAAKQD